VNIQKNINTGHLMCHYNFCQI